MMLSFEDFPPGHFGTFGPRLVTREEILAFAAEFDPQPMHLDEEAASRSMLKGLSGSGWHLCSIMMRMMFDGFIGRTASLGSPGEAVRPIKPSNIIRIMIEQRCQPEPERPLSIDRDAASSSRCIGCGSNSAAKARISSRLTRRGPNVPK